MPDKPFDVATKEQRFVLPDLTKQQIKALIADLNQDARSVIIIAVAELYGREIENERDVFAELDEIRATLGI